MHEAQLSSDNHSCDYNLQGDNDVEETTTTDIPKRRIQFPKLLDVMLLKAIIATDAHWLVHGQALEKILEALNIFKISATSTLFTGVEQPTWKISNDRYKKIISDHCTAVTRNKIFNGILEVIGEQKFVLDDIMHAVDENGENIRTERDEKWGSMKNLE